MTNLMKLVHKRMTDCV